MITRGFADKLHYGGLGFRLMVMGFDVEIFGMDLGDASFAGEFGWIWICFAALVEGWVA